jgi:hypothetical protein
MALQFSLQNILDLLKYAPRPPSTVLTLTVSIQKIRPHHDPLPPLPIQMGRSRLLHERLLRRTVVSLLREEGERTSDPRRVDGRVTEEEAEVGNSGSWNHRGLSPESSWRRMGESGSKSRLPWQS